MNTYRPHEFAKLIAKSPHTLQRWDREGILVHAVVDKATTIVAEDLTAKISGKNFGKNVNQRLASWTKNVIAEAIENVFQRRGSTLALVNPAYTSQIDSRNGCLLGRRQGDQFYCCDGLVLQADENAARNVLAPPVEYCPTRTHSSCRLQNLSTESELSNEYVYI